MERSTLKATTPLVSEKVAKVLTAKNTFYEKELSYVRKTLEREANYCKATIDKAKSNLIKSLEANGSLHARRKTNAVCRERSVSLPRSVKSKRLDVLFHRSIPDQSQKVTRSEVLCVNDIDNTLSPVCSTSIILPEGRSTHAITYDEDEDPFLPKTASSTETDDDILPTQRRAFDLQSLGEPSLFNSQKSEAAEIPEILVTGVDNNNNQENTNNSETPQRKISLTRSYSTGDLPSTNVADKPQHREAVACSSPVQIRRVRSTSTFQISGSLPQNCKEGKTTTNDDKTRHGSLDELFSQRLSNVLTDHNVPPKPKPRFQPYSEEPFYLRKKWVLRRCFDRKDLHKKGETDGLVNNSNHERTKERPLASLLPPVALPSIYSQQITKSKTITDEKKRYRDKKNGTRNPKLTVDVSSLTQNLTDCRYLRSNTQ